MDRKRFKKGGGVGGRGDVEEMKGMGKRQRDWDRETKRRMREESVRTKLILFFVFTC